MKNSDKGLKKPTLLIAYLVIVSVYTAVMLISGFVVLSVVGAALAIITALLSLITFAAKKKINRHLLIGFLIVTCGIVLYYLIWGAEPFLRRAWYNLALGALPIAAASFLLAWASYKKRDTVIRAAVASVMVLSIGFYLMAMSIRARPKVFSLKKGHDEYLDSIKGSAKEGAPNILLIVMDDMAYADISCYSYLGRAGATIKTPNLDALADEGVLFENFYACSPVCSPSRFGILTGRYSNRGYVDEVVFPSVVSFKPFGDTRLFNPFIFKNNVEGLLGDEITIAEALKSAGYSTALFGKWNLGDYGQYLPTNQGFDYFYGSYYVNDMTPYNWVKEESGKSVQVKSHYDIKDQSETTKLLTAEVTDYISEKAERGQKFFACYATPWPHYPIYSGNKGDTSDDSYIHCIEEFDRYLGDILNTLKAKGVYDDTIIMFTSDNGPGREGVAGALRGRKGTTFEGGQKVPMIVSYPAGNVGKGEKVITAPAMNIDIFPTLLEYAGIDALPQDRVIDGVSMYALLEGKIPAGTAIHDALYYIRNGKVQAVQMPVDIEGETYNFKYYQRVASENTAFFDQVYRNYLFNLSLDPAEGYNTSMIYPATAKTMAGRLESFRKELRENRRGINKDYYGK